MYYRKIIIVSEIQLIFPESKTLHSNTIFSAQILFNLISKLEIYFTAILISLFLLKKITSTSYSFLDLSKIFFFSGEETTFQYISDMLVVPYLLLIYHFNFIIFKKATFPTSEGI